MKQTDFLKMNLMESTDFFNVEDINANTSLIDANLKEQDTMNDCLHTISNNIDVLVDGEVVIKPTNEVGGVSPTDGSISSAATNYVVSPFLLIPKNATGFVTNYKTNSNYFGYAFYDNDKTFISGGKNQAKQDTSGVCSLVYEFPTNAVYMVICNSKVLHEDLTDLYITFVSNVMETIINPIKENVNSIFENYSRISNGILEVRPCFVNGNVDMSSGTMHNGSVHYLRTDFIKLPKNCSKIETDIKTQSAYFGITFHDSEKKYISGIALTSVLNVITEIPDNAEYIICCNSVAYSMDRVIRFYTETATTNNNKNDIIGISSSNKKLAFDFADDRVFDSSFNIIYKEGYKITYPISVEYIERLYVENTVSGSCRYAFYDSDDSIVSSGSTGANLMAYIDVPAKAKTFIIAFSDEQSSTITVKNVPKLCGKNVSIVGDSISTYDGYIPDGYAAYYPTGDVSSVDSTWWKRVIDKTGMTLLKNASWSGSSVCGQSGDTTGKIATSEKRISDLSDGTTAPDIIIVYIGTNDWHAENRAIGDFDSHSEIPADGNLLKFSNAYALMMYRIRTTYPSAKVFCITEFEGRLLDNDTTYPIINSWGATIHDVNHQIIEIAHIFGAEVIDLETIGVHFWNVENYTVDSSNIHPNASCMELISDEVVKHLLR